jgi:hypothetical protein
MTPRREKREAEPPLLDEHDIPPDPAPNSRRIPAGQVLWVLLIGLSLAAFMNADRVAALVSAKPIEESGREWKLDVWEGLASISHWFALDRPRNELETAIGREDTEILDITQIESATGDPGGDDEPSADTGEDDPEPTTTTTIDYTPVVRTPTLEEPLTFWLGGDSMTQTFGDSMGRVVAQTGVLSTADIDYRVSTGLSRPDFFDWPGHIVNDVLPVHDPDVMVIMFGANDSQGLELADGSVCYRFEQCWLDTYRQRVAATMDLLRSEDNDRIIVWVGQPIMGPTSGVYGMDKLNFIYWDEARQRDWIYFFDSSPYFEGADGEYSHYLDSINGTEAPMRQQDQVHFSTQGGDRLSWAVLAYLKELIDLSASTDTPDGATAPPDGIERREDLPEATAEIID